METDSTLFNWSCDRHHTGPELRAYRLSHVAATPPDNLVLLSVSTAVRGATMDLGENSKKNSKPLCERIRPSPTTSASEMAVRISARGVGRAPCAASFCAALLSVTRQQSIWMQPGALGGSHGNSDRLPVVVEMAALIALQWTPRPFEQLRAISSR